MQAVTKMGWDPAGKPPFREGLVSEAQSAGPPFETIGAAQSWESRGVLVLVLLGLIVVLAITPALVGAQSLIDGNLLERAKSGFDWSLALGLVRIGSALALAFTASVAKDDL